MILFCHFVTCFCIFAHVSRSVTVRLKTRAPGRESFESTQKYPSRSNCSRAPGLAAASDGSTRQPRQDLQRLGIQVRQPVLARFHIVRVGLGEEVVVQPHLGLQGVGGTDPVQRGIDLAAIGGVAAVRGGVVGAVEFH